MCSSVTAKWQDQPQPVEHRDANGHLTDADGKLIREPKCTYRDCQPQPAWEAQYHQLCHDKGIYDSEPDVPNFIRSLLATERLKWQKEVRTEIEELEQQTRKEKRSEFRLYAFSDVLDLPSLTPSPQEETK